MLHFLFFNTIMLSVYNLFGIVVGIVITHTRLQGEQLKASEMKRAMLDEPNTIVYIT
jgi:hypothetical protein